MATRIYFADSTANTGGYGAGKKSSALPGGTSNDPQDRMADLSFTKAATHLQEINSLAQTAHQDGLLGRYFSPVLQVSSISAQTWQIAYAINEGNGAANAFLALSVYVLQSNDTVRGFVYDVDAALGLEAGGGSAQVVSFSGSSVASIVNTDRLVVELWLHATQTMNTSYLLGTWDSGLGGDMTDGGGAEGNAAWIETPQDNLFTAVEYQPRHSAVSHQNPAVV